MVDGEFLLLLVCEFRDTQLIAVSLFVVLLDLSQIFSKDLETAFLLLFRVIALVVLGDKVFERLAYICLLDMYI